MTRKQAERQESLETLHRYLKPGDTVHTILKHVSRSGMQRTITPLKLIDNDPIYLGYHVGRVIDARTDGDHGVKMGGCGMDMGFQLVYLLSSALWPDGFDCIGEGCPANDHFNRENNSHHRDGGYALKHRWL